MKPDPAVLADHLYIVIAGMQNLMTDPQWTAIFFSRPYECAYADAVKTRLHYSRNDMISLDVRTDVDDRRTSVRVLVPLLERIRMLSP